MSKQSEAQFVEWLRRNDPFLFLVAQKRMELNSGSGLGAIDFGAIFTNVVNTIKDVAPSVIAAQGQKRILDLQIERARNNLPPLDTTNYMPSVKIAAEITPENEAAAIRIAQQTANDAAQKMKPYFFGGLALAAYLFFKKGRR